MSDQTLTGCPFKTFLVVVIAEAYPHFMVVMGAEKAGDELLLFYIQDVHKMTAPVFAVGFGMVP